TSSAAVDRLALPALSAGSPQSSLFRAPSSVVAQPFRIRFPPWPARAAGLRLVAPRAALAARARLKTAAARKVRRNRQPRLSLPAPEPVQVRQRWSLRDLLRARHAG